MIFFIINGYRLNNNHNSIYSYYSSIVVIYNENIPFYGNELSTFSTYAPLCEALEILEKKAGLSPPYADPGIIRRFIISS
jgi:hypothetical protein